MSSTQSKNPIKSTNDSSSVRSKSFERVNIVSQIPLELNPKDRSLPKKRRKFKFKKKIHPISKFGQMFDYSNTEHKIRDFLPIDVAKPSHQSVKKVEKPFSITPDPASYFPDYSVKFPNPKFVDLHKDKVQPPKKHRSATTASIVHEYNVDIRNFDLKKFERLSDGFQPSDVNISPSRIAISFSEQSPRPDIVGKKPLTSDSDQLFNFPVEKVPSVSFEHQPKREFNYPADLGDDYSSKAVIEFKNIHPIPQVTRMDQQISRDYVPPANEKLEFLDQLKRRRAQYLDKFCIPNDNNSVSPRKGRSSSFDKQIGRKVLFGDVHCFDPKIPLDVTASINYTKPRVRTIIIK